MKTLLRFLPWLVLAAAVCLRAQLPPPTAAGTVDIEVSVGGDTRFVQQDYQPPKPYTILAETLTRSVAAASTPILVPGKAGSVTSVFAFDENYSSSHPEIQRPIRGTGPNFESVAYYRSVSLRTDWDEQGRPTFSLRGLTGRTGSLLAIEGRGEGRIFQNEGGPSAYPSPRYRVEDVIRTEGKVPWFSLGRLVVGGTSYPLDYRYLTGAGNFWTETQPDGTAAVFHTAFYRPLGNELGEFYPIGAVTTSGTSGEPPHFQTQTESLTPDAALQKLKAADWSFTGEFVATSPATAVYVSDSNGATASKLRYKLQVQPGLARTIVWSETFTPEGAGEPSEYRFISEDVSATASETLIHTLDPFQWLEGRPGRYEVVAFDSESFDATLTADTNRDGALVSAGGPITPYVIAHADTVSTEQPFLLAVNADDDDADGVLDRADAVVNGADDLADFVPVFLNIKQLLATLPPSANARYKLKQADGALNFVYTDLMQATAFNYLNNPGGGFGPAFDQPAAVAPVEAITPDGVELSADFLNRIQTQGQGVILIEATRPTQQPLLLAVETATGTAIVRLPLLAYEASIAVDANRDGEIKADGLDVTSAERPFGFWLNDDDDSGDKDHINSSHKDGDDGEINSVRDLEDFTRLKLYLGGLQDAIVQGKIQVGLKWKDTTGSPSLKLWRNFSPNGGTEYLTNPTVAQQHLALGNPGLVQGSTPYIIPTQYWQDVGLSASQPYGNLLFEGCTAGKGQLVITLHKADGAVIGEGSGVWLDLKNIKSMYERAVATTGGPRSENGVDYTIPLPYDYVGPDSNNIPRPTMGWEPNTLGYPYESDPAEVKTYFIYVHGWRWSPEKANNRAETVFKRLWHLGYKGRFAALRWPTFYGGPDDGDDWIAGLSTYNDSEYRAWKSGESLKLYVNQLPAGYIRNVVAHSMGNIVTGSALRQGMSVANYVLLNAAVPAMCYDESTTLYQPWVYTTPNDDPDSGSKALAYIGKLKTLNTNVVNFYLPRDSATTSAWETNNYQFKPQNQIITSCVRGYSYVRSHAPGTKLFVDFCVSPLRYLIDEHESMAFACQSLTKTVGADGRTVGPIVDSVDMDTSFGFGDEHGAEWDRNYAQTKAFYQRLLIAVGNSTP